MAQINIQRKSSQAMWWILGLIALVLIVWWLFAAGTPDRGISRMDSEVGGVVSLDRTAPPAPCQPVEQQVDAARTGGLQMPCGRIAGALDRLQPRSVEV